MKANSILWAEAGNGCTLAKGGRRPAKLLYMQHRFCTCSNAMSEPTHVAASWVALQCSRLMQRGSGG